MPMSIQEGIPVGSAWYQCNSCKSCSSFAPILFFVALLCQGIVSTKSYQRNWKNMRRNLKTKCKLGHWSLYKRPWMVLESNLSSQAHLLWPNLQHPKGWNIATWVGSSGKGCPLILNSWTLLLVSHLQRNWERTPKKKKIIIIIN